MVPRAAVAGATDDAAEMDAIAKRMQRLHRRLVRAGKRLRAHADTFNMNAAMCEGQ